MQVQESSRGGSVGSFFGVVFTLVGIAVLLGIGFSFWPKIKAAYYTTPAAQQSAPTQAPAGDSDAIKAMQAQVKALQAQLSAAQQRIVVQQVPAREVAQPLTTTGGSNTPANTTDNTTGDSSPPAAPVVIVLHENDNHGAPVVTGSGACQVAAKGARRCGDK